MIEWYRVPHPCDFERRQTEMGWVSEIFHGIKDFKLTDVLRERITLKEEQYKKLEKEAIELKHSVAALEKDNEQLRQELMVLRADDAFVLDGGVLWKKKPGGGFEKTPYCQTCKKQMLVLGFVYFANTILNLVAA